jgi:hypothetical protein
VSGYTPCACRDCMEIAIGEPGEAYCHECESAGCPEYQGVEGMSQECQCEPELEEECSMCGGPLMELGALGNTKHYRCRNCGMGAST